MKTRHLILATLLVLAPGLAAARCFEGHQAMSCAEGLVWDHQTGTCVEQVSS